MIEFLVKNWFSILLFSSSLLVGYGYYKSKIEDLIEDRKKVNEMETKIIDLEKFQAVQESTNSYHSKQWDDIVEWMKSLEAKLDKALQR